MLKIGGNAITADSDAYVIAEIGHNHQGDLDKAELLLRLAAKAGASAAKFQRRDNRSLYTRAMYDQPYEGRNSFGPTYGLHREALELDRSQYVRLAEVAAEIGIDLLSTPFDQPSVDFVVDIGVPAIKIASADVTNIPLLTYAAQSGKPLILSTGAADLADVRRACDAILPINDQLALLQCTAKYPATPADLNLAVIGTYLREFPGQVVGFSGHDPGCEAAWIAYALGARIIEKHFTLDRNARGSDHRFSLEPDDLGELVVGLRRIRESLGSPVKQCLPVEREALRKMGKKLVAARELAAGSVLTADDIQIKSPGIDGLRPYLLPEVLGRTLAMSVPKDGDITFAALDRSECELPRR